MRKLILFVITLCALIIQSGCIDSHSSKTGNKTGINNSMQNESTMNEHEFTVGNTIDVIKEIKKDNILLNQHSCIVWKDTEGYNIACIGNDGKTITALIRFSETLELLETNGVDLIGEVNQEEWVGKKEDEFIAEYGQCHFDFGSGRYIPSYISKTGKIFFLNVDGDGKIKSISTTLLNETSRKQGILLPNN